MYTSKNTVSMTRFLPSLVLGLGVAFFSAIAQADVDSLVLETPTKFDGLLYSDGKLFATAGWDGTAIYEIKPNGAPTVLGQVPGGPIDMVANSKGDLIITSYGASSVFKLNPTTGESEVIAKLPSFAGSIINYKPNEYLVGSASSLYWVNEAGDVALYYKDTDRIDNPTGLVMDENRNIYVGNLDRSNVFKIDDKTKAVTDLATLPRNGPYNIGKLLFIDGALYATHLANHSIYQLSATGVDYKVLTGQTDSKTEQDGELNMAHFVNPNGLAWDDKNQTIWVAPAFGAAKQLRKVTLAP